MSRRFSFTKNSRRAAFLLLALSSSVPLGAQEVDDLEATPPKPIPLEETPPHPATKLIFNGVDFSVKVDPAQASSQRIANGVTNSVQQQLEVAVEQIISPYFSIIYRAQAGFKTVETSVEAQHDQTAANLSMLQSPALAWKPREGTEVQVAYENTDSLNQNWQNGQAEAFTANAKMKFSDQTNLALAGRAERDQGPAGQNTRLDSVSASLEQALPNTPLKLVLGPGWQETTAADGTEAIRAFLDSALIWKMDDWTSLTAGSSFGGNGISHLDDSYYLLVQHQVLANTGIEMRAALLQSSSNNPDEGFSLSAQSTVALAQALSAGLGVRYQLLQNPAFARPGGETFLSLSINGSF